jgi:hypothetical protein
MIRSRFVASWFLLVFVFLFSTQGFAQDRAEFEKKMAELREQLKATEKQFLEPSEEDKTAHADFLNQTDTGIVRLMPREKYDYKLTIRGGASYYSFTQRSPEYGSQSQLYLQQGKFWGGIMGADFAFITSLGNVPIQSVNSEHPAVQFLATYTPPSIEAEAREQHQISLRGLKIGEFTGYKSVEAKVNTTYLLRAVHYSPEGVDVLVSFRAIRQDTDGSVTILWKILKKFQTPELARP